MERGSLLQALAQNSLVEFVCMLKSSKPDTDGMTLDEKLRYGTVALAGAAVVLSALGVRASPLDIISGSGL